MNRRVARWVAAGALAVAAVVTVAGPAVAAPAALPAVDVEVCLGEPPEPANPLSNGPLSIAMPRPAQIPAGGDPFAADATTTILEQYGSAGPFWATYDNGCPIATTSQVPKLWTTLANLGFGLPQFLTLGTASLANLLLSPTSWLSSLDAPVDSVGKSLGETVKPLLGLAFMVMTVGLAWAARRGKIGAALTTVLFGLVAVGLFALGSSGPSKIASQLDKYVTSAVSAGLGANTTAGRPMGPVVVGPLWEAVAYDRWCEGVLGSSTSYIAKKYCPRLFRAQAMTWAEAFSVEGNQEKTDKMITEKKAEWAKVAAEIKTEAKSTYTKHLTGNEAGGRIGAAALSTFVAAVVLPFILVALFMAGAGYIVLRMVVMMSPVLAVILVIHRDMLRKLGRIVAAVLMNTFFLALGATAVLGVAGALLKSDIPVLGAVLMTGIVSAVAWAILRPFRRVGQMVSGGKSAGSALGSPAEGAKSTGGAAKTAGNVAVGVAAAATGGTAAVVAAATRRKKSDKDDEGSGDEQERPEAQQPSGTPVAPYQERRPDPQPSQPAPPREVPITVQPSGETNDSPEPAHPRVAQDTPVRALPASTPPAVVDPSPADEDKPLTPTAVYTPPVTPASTTGGDWTMFDPATGRTRTETPDR